MNQYFRVKMLRSWAIKLGECYLPSSWQRVTAVMGEGNAKECVVLIHVAERKPIGPAAINMHIRTQLDGFDGYLLVESVSEQDAHKILEAK